jgi:pSer/pThr/pTyr-binding forkhead associated (FHA) protein
LPPVKAIETPRIILKTPKDVQTVQLDRHKIWTIGRDRDNLIQIPDRLVSRFHAKLEIFENRHCCFWDLSSRNGSLHNELPIASGVLLNHGDRIKIGSAELLFKHSFIATSDLHQAQSNRQVLMVHASATQGKIWQEILLSQDIAVIWETPGVDLKQLISLSTTSNTLPQLLIIDVRAVPKDVYTLSRWCRVQQIKVQILLIDSHGTEISESKQTQARARGFLGLYPAFSQKLLSRKSELAQQVWPVLKACGLMTLKDKALFKALEKLDQLLHEAAHPIAVRCNGNAGFKLEEMSLDELTSLKINPRKLKQR